MKIALGVGGGIAAYKAAEVARRLMERGHTGQVILTESAQQFIRPLTFAALTGQKVITGLFSEASPEATLSSSVEHIGVAQESDLLLVAPATADLLAKFAHGLASDFLSTTYLAFTGPVVLAPAMNSNMWQHPATQANVAVLRQRPGHHLIAPDSGLLACGTTGPGRLAEPDQIAAFVDAVAHPRHDLDGETVLITAGPTQEPLDPVRYITNRSSGKMGYALAEAARDRGARVVLITGPVHIAEPAGVEMVHVRTALQMREAVMEQLEKASIIIKAAAVADYHVVDVPDQKVKKSALRLSLNLDPTPDILAEAGRRKGDRLLIGFAAETQNLVAEARRKLETKHCDMVVGNLVNSTSTGFESDMNEVTLVMSTGETVEVPAAPKRAIADVIFDHALRLRLALHGAH
jgi:phosphopantothenoylcysteine decarboxylase/phosphopantothenate--cysteine ligase